MSVNKTETKSKKKVTPLRRNGEEETRFTSNDFTISEGEPSNGEEIAKLDYLIRLFGSVLKNKKVVIYSKSELAVYIIAQAVEDERGLKAVPIVSVFDEPQKQLNEFVEGDAMVAVISDEVTKNLYLNNVGEGVVHFDVPKSPEAFERRRDELDMPEPIILVQSEDDEKERFLALIKGERYEGQRLPRVESFLQQLNDQQVESEFNRDLLFKMIQDVKVNPVAVRFMNALVVGISNFTRLDAVQKARLKKQFLSHIN